MPQIASDSSTPAASIDARIADLIISDSLRAGDALPSVRALARRWNVGFNVVRDAITRAAAFGIVEIRPRSRVVVKNVDYDTTLASLARTLHVTFGQHEHKLAHLWDARATLEIETVSKAATRRLPEDLANLRRMLEELRRVQNDRKRFVLVDEQFHLAIARIAGNPVLHVMLDVVLKLLRPDRMIKQPSAGKTSSVMVSHEAIYKAILDGDAAKAGKLVAEHYQRRVRYLLEYSDDGE
jgi:GntR family transcriptional repressor for pyruvate dehydrogenase complex